MEKKPFLTEAMAQEIIQEKRLTPFIFMDLGDERDDPAIPGLRLEPVTVKKSHFSSFSQSGDFSPNFASILGEKLQRLGETAAVKEIPGTQFDAKNVKSRPLFASKIVNYSVISG